MEDLSRDSEPGADGATLAVRSEIGRRIAEAIDGLDVKAREVVILRGIENLSNEEAAGVLGDHPNTVAQRYRRALQKLRSSLPRSIFDDLVEA